MKFVSSSLKIAIFACTFLLLTITSVFAKTHVIEFGDLHGPAYIPNQLSVAVGDTIEWMGTFEYHPLKSTSVPISADTFGAIDTGVTFIYVVAVPGHYSYQCNIHFAGGMIGSFDAIPAGVATDLSISLSAQNFPNPFDKQTTISYSLINPSDVILMIFDLTGKEILHSFYGSQPAGSHKISFDGAALPNGIYSYKLQTSDAILQRQMIISR
jgi:plastocyanin